MTFVIRNLGYGQLPVLKGTLYTTPVGLCTIVKTITYVNTCNILGQAVNLYIRPSAGFSSIRIIPPDLGLCASYSLIWDDEICLGPEDLIEGDAANANMVDYEIFGIEEI